MALKLLEKRILFVILLLLAMLIANSSAFVVLGKGLPI